MLFITLKSVAHVIMKPSTRSRTALARVKALKKKSKAAPTRAKVNKATLHRAKLSEAALIQRGMSVQCPVSLAMALRSTRASSQVRIATNAQRTNARIATAEFLILFLDRMMMYDDDMCRRFLDVAVKLGDMRSTKSPAQAVPMIPDVATYCRNGTSAMY